MSREVFGTREWAPVNANCSLGCNHDCKYCYAKSMAMRFGRRTAATWRAEDPYLHRACQVAKMEPTRVMFPTTHDITPGILDTCLTAMGLMLGHGHELLVVSKPHLGCIKAICQAFEPLRSKILFRFTIGSLEGRRTAPSSRGRTGRVTANIERRPPHALLRRLLT